MSSHKKFPLPLTAVARQDQAAKKKIFSHSVKQHSSLRTFTNGVKDLGSQKSDANNVGLVSDAVRRQMVERLRQQGIVNQKVLAAMQQIPRHQFVDSGLASQAYSDTPLPIGHQQTISQPYIVARMLELIFNSGKMDKVLEIGTGCGYQAAILSLLYKEVYSIERIKPLHELAKKNLRHFRIPNIRLHYGDGMLGLKSVAPFSAIVVAAAGLDIPASLLEQLEVGGCLIIPVGAQTQTLYFIERTAQASWTKHELDTCRFVPLLAGTVG